MNLGNVLSKLRDVLNKLSKKQKIILGVVVAVLVLGGIRQQVVARNDLETAKKNAQVLNVCVNGWQIKELARLGVNRDKTREIKQQLMNFYDPKSGELAEQQRLVDGLIAADDAKNEEKHGQGLDTNTNLQVIGFTVTQVTLKSANVGNDTADVTADIQYYIKYDTQHQNYSDLITNTLTWQLKKNKNRWIIVNEDLVTGDQK